MLLYPDFILLLYSQNKMKTRTKYLGAAGLLLALVLGSSVVMKSPELTQGALGAMGTWKLAASSPSGAMAVSTSDSIFAFTVKAATIRGLTFEDGTHFDFTFSSTTNDIDAFTPAGSRVILRDEDGRAMGYGYVATNDQGENPTAAWASVYFRNGTWSPAEISVEAGENMTYTLEVDSSALMLEDTGEDDELVVSMTYNGNTVTGKTLKY